MLIIITARHEQDFLTLTKTKRPKSNNVLQTMCIDVFAAKYYISINAVNQNPIITK